ncbi:ubiquinone biosynthesis protein UbiB [Nitrosomonas sp. HPC101]|uniref:ABC1 kinase family protein n=1 Tax=Nitrosomonas sp. HPC101 TaxID=1658667 RepID=UPI00136BEB36|nr:AarF/UbiB family protein [Nitrosomonas sp. HPC101]MXS86510.1 ubiquinone biosynthesis protein UbiB [Nitrosomonas sp. HPC101]
MLWQTLKAMRDVGRLHEIASVLIRYGFGDLVRRLGLANTLEHAGKVLHWSEARDLAHMTPPERVRRAFEDMGPTFVKLGQVLATRVDLLEPDWIAEFGKLQNNAPPVPWEDVLPQMIEDLGAPPDEVFASFDTTPMAAASIAQVYRARLTDGDEVVVKVRRPGIRRVIDADLHWLSRLAAAAEAESPEWRALHPTTIVRQLSLSLRRELDFTNESRNAERIADNFKRYTDADYVPTASAVDKTPGGAWSPADDAARNAPEPPIIVIPRIYWQWTSERVCVQQLIQGIPARKLEVVDEAGLDRQILARRGAQAVLKMIIEDGLFHADPHPGNIFYLPGNRISFIDFGMVGRLGEERRDQLIRLLLGLVKYDAQAVVNVVLEWTSDDTVNEQELISEIEAFVDQYHGVPLKQLRIGEILSDLMVIPRRYHIILPADLVLLIKAFITLEGLGRELDPEFDMATQTLPLLEHMMHERYKPAAVFRRGRRTASELFSLLGGLPQDISRLLRAARRSPLEIHVDVIHLKRVGDQLDSAANRLVVGIIVAALIIGSSIVMTVPGGPTLLGLPLFGLIGFVGASIGSIWLLISILRSGRK